MTRKTEKATQGGYYPAQILAFLSESPAGCMYTCGGDWLLQWYAVTVCGILRNVVVGCVVAKHIVWEAKVERRCVFDALDLLGGQGNVQRGDVLLETFDLSATHDREHVGQLMQVVRDRNRCDATSFAISSSTSHTFFCSRVRSHSGSNVVRPFSPLSLRQASSAFVRIFPPASTPQGTSARPSARAIGMISRSNDRSKTDQLPWYTLNGVLPWSLAY